MSIKRTAIRPHSGNAEMWWTIKVNGESVWTDKVQYKSACSRARRMVKQGWARKVEVDSRIVGVDYADAFLPACMYEWAED